MKTLLISVLLALPAGVSAQDLSNASLDDLPGNGAMKAAAAEDNVGPVQRPDSAKIMAELSSALRLSSKQEERISSAVNKKTGEFDKMMKEFEKNAQEEKKWRYKMNETRHAMQAITRGMPDTVREYLDDEQRQVYDGMLDAGNKPAAPAEAPALEQGKPAPEAGAGKPLRKRRVLKRRKVTAGTESTSGSVAAAPAAPAAAVPAEEEAGQVMVDKEPAAPRPAARKKRVLRKKAAPAAPAEDMGPGEPAGAKPTGKEAPAAEEDAGSYP